MRQRWLWLAISITLVSLSFIEGTPERALVAFAVGVVAGFLIDSIGSMKLCLWKYPRQPYLTKEYLLIVVPCWGIFGMMVNLLWDWIEVSPWVVFVVLVVGLGVFWEALNLKTKSWEYHAPKWSIVVGWFPLLLVLRIPYLAFC